MYVLLHINNKTSATELYKQYKPTVADGLQCLVAEQYKTAKPISDSSIILFWFLKFKKNHISILH